MGCMPYGRFDAESLCPKQIVSIPHMGCMPYGPWLQVTFDRGGTGFNPSYGLHALRARTVRVLAWI